MEERQRQVMLTNFSHACSTLVDFFIDPSFYLYMEDMFVLDGYIYLDPHKNHGHVTHNTKRFMDL